MSDIAHFFKPLNLSTLIGNIELKEAQLGNLINAFTEGGELPELENVHLAIFGVNESRNSHSNSGAKLAPDEIRKQLYSLYSGSFDLKAVDLGNIDAGHSTNDTYYAVSAVVDYLIRKNIIPIILGGTQDLCYAQFLGYKNLEQTINMVSVDSSFDLGNPDEEIANNSYLGKIILHQPNYLFNYSNIGFQSYLVDPASLGMMTKLYFDFYRLGEIRGKIEEAEPIIRQADMLCFDIGCIKHSDAPAQTQPSPNGFYAEDACQMMRYAGLNDKLSSIGIYEINPEFDINSKTSALAAQMIWCFMEGFYQRKNDFPNKSSSDYLRFHVVLQDEKYEINFYKSKKTDRWWMEIPYPPHKDLKYERHTLIPCSYKDYELATKNEIPDRWWQTYQKLF